MHHSLELYDIHLRLGNVPVLQGISVEAAPCEFVSIVGAERWREETDTSQDRQWDAPAR